MLVILKIRLKEPIYPGNKQFKKEYEVNTKIAKNKTR